MGVTIDSKNYSIDLGYGGFSRLRNKVAELAGPDIYEHYKYLDNGVSLYGEERTKFFEDYDRKIKELDEKYNGKKSKILDFLYECDCSGKMNITHCKAIWKEIEDYDDNILYGYSGRPDCAMFKDFKKIVKDCIDTKTIMKWY